MSDKHLLEPFRPATSHVYTTHSQLDSSVSRNHPVMSSCLSQAFSFSLKIISFSPSETHGQSVTAGGKIDHSLQERPKRHSSPALGELLPFSSHHHLITALGLYPRSLSVNTMIGVYHSEKYVFITYWCQTSVILETVTNSDEF